MKRSKSKKFKLQKRHSELQETELLESWIESGKPDSGFNPLSSSPLPEKSRIGRLQDGSFSRYVGVEKFKQLPLSKRTKDGLAESKYANMTDIQRASLPHSLCGRDVLGASKTGSGKTLAFIIPVLEKLYRAWWGPEDGIGCIIMSPTRELGAQLFEVLKCVGRHHGFSAGLLIGGRKDVKMEKECVNELNILVCTPGRLLQHMDETPNFDCSQLQVLVLDEADRILDRGFKKEVNAIISQLPRHRQTLLFSATQTKSVEDLARLSLKDPEYLSVDEESARATPKRLQECAVIVPLDKKIDVLWDFLKKHINSRILVFISSRKQARFVHEVFRKLQPGTPLMYIHGGLKQERRMAICSYFSKNISVLFSTALLSRGLDFKNIDWIVQVDCPENVEMYIHKVGRTARYLSGGRSVLFLTPSETKMLEELREKNIPIQSKEVNIEKLQTVSGMLSSLLVKYPNLQILAQRAFQTYLNSIMKRKDKEAFDVSKLPIVEFAASLGLPITPKLCFPKGKLKGKCVAEEPCLVPGSVSDKNLLVLRRESLGPATLEELELEQDLLLEKEHLLVGDGEADDIGDAVLATRVLKKKKLKINVHRPVSTRVVFDEDGNSLPPLAKFSDTKSSIGSVLLDREKVNQRYAELREQMKRVDKEDKALDRERRKRKRLNEKMKRKKARDEEEDDVGSEDNLSGSYQDAKTSETRKKVKIYFDSDGPDDDERKTNEGKIGVNADSITLAEQEALALKLLSSMHP